MDKITDYKIVHWHEVEKMILEGWQPLGGAFATDGIYQTIVKYAEVKIEIDYDINSEFK